MIGGAAPAMLTLIQTAMHGYQSTGLSQLVLRRSALVLLLTPRAVEFATLEWVDWFNNRRLLEPIGNIRRPKPRHANATLEAPALAA